VWKLGRCILAPIATQSYATTFLQISKPFPSYEMIKYSLFYHFIFIHDCYICYRVVLLPLQEESRLCFHGNSINMEFMGSSYDGDYKNGR